MADISPTISQAVQRDRSYALRVDGRLDDRQAAESSSSQRAEITQSSQQAQEARATQVTDDARKLDAQQRLRDQQLAQDLQRLERQRQDEVTRADQARDRAATQPRGSLVDLYA